MVSISKEVYSPSEDSWLLEECILKENLVGKKCLDLGTGLGIQSIAMLKSGASAVLAVDINPLAIKESKKRVLEYLKKNKKVPNQVWKIKKSNLFSNIKEKFDFIAFNPPYVPSDEIKWVDLDGGEKGRIVIDKFVAGVALHLNKKGILLLLVSSLNKPKEIEHLLKEKGFVTKVVGKKKLFFEELIVLRAVKI
ncbi:MAG: HemK2/MTQ2 family protein methyltransferase [archaeon]